MAKELSRQRKWQLKKRAEGLCESCGDPAEKSRCPACMIKQRERVRNRLGCSPKEYGKPGRPLKYK